MQPIPSNAQLKYAPKDHSWVEAISSVPFYAQATYPVNQFAIPPYDEIQLTNDGSGNPTVAAYLKESVLVATLTFTYDGNSYLTNVAISYP